VEEMRPLTPGEFFWWAVAISGAIAFWYVTVPAILLFGWWLSSGNE